MKFSLFFTAVFFFVGVQNFVDGIDCEFRQRLSSAVKELRQKPLGEFVQDFRDVISKRSHPESLSHFAQNLESFLSRVIPNRNLVQDLLGYVSMKRPGLEGPLNF